MQQQQQFINCFQQYPTNSSTFTLSVSDNQLHFTYIQLLKLILSAESELHRSQHPMSVGITEYCKMQLLQYNVEFDMIKQSFVTTQDADSHIALQDSMSQYDTNQPMSEDDYYSLFTPRIETSFSTNHYRTTPTTGLRNMNSSSSKNSHHNNNRYSKCSITSAAMREGDAIVEKHMIRGDTQVIIGEGIQFTCLTKHVGILMDQQIDNSSDTCAMAHTADTTYSNNLQEPASISSINTAPVPTPTPTPTHNITTNETAPTTAAESSSIPSASYTESSNLSSTSESPSSSSLSSPIHKQPSEKKSVLLVGSPELLLSQNIVLTSQVITMTESLRSEGKNVVLVALDKQLLAVLAVDDMIRSEANLVINQLNHANIECVMMTSDEATTAHTVGATVGIPSNNIYSNMKPTDKENLIHAMQKLGKRVAFVGNNTDDTPALTAAHVGISMSSATGASTNTNINTNSSSCSTDRVESAGDIVLYQKDLKSILTCLDLAKTTMNRIQVNYIGIFCYHIIMIPLAAGVLFPICQFTLTPIIACIIMVLSTICITISILLLLFFQPSEHSFKPHPWQSKYHNKKSNENNRNEKANKNTNKNKNKKSSSISPLLYVDNYNNNNYNNVSKSISTMTNTTDATYTTDTIQNPLIFPSAAGSALTDTTNTMTTTTATMISTVDTNTDPDTAVYDHWISAPAPVDNKNNKKQNSEYNGMLPRFHRNL